MIEKANQSNSAVAREEKVLFKGPSGNLEGLTFGLTSTVIPPLIGVICHPHPLYQGTMNNKVVTTIAKAWQELGLPTVRFNFRGVGASEGSYGNGVGEIEDLQAVLAELQQQYPQVNFWLAGFSFGSFIALSVATQQRFPKRFPIQALLTVAPPVHHFDFLNLQIPPCPWLIIQGLLDTVVPADKVLSWVEEIKKTEKTVRSRTNANEMNGSAQGPTPTLTVNLNSNKDQCGIELVTMPTAEHFFHGQLVELKSIIQNKMQLLIQKA